MEMLFMNKSLGPGSTTDHTNQTILFLCDHSASTKAKKIFAFSILLIISLVGNSLTIAVFINNRQLRNPVNYFILNMAISDLLIPLLVLPYRISQVHYDGMWLIEGAAGSVLCKVLSLPLSVSTAVSIFSMVVIAVERFYSILFAMRPPLINNKTCLVLIAVTWITAVLFRAHLLYAYTVVRITNTARFCIFVWPSSTNEALKANWLTFFVCLTAIPLVLMIILYSSIIIYLYRQERHLLLASEMVQRRAKENKQITCMLVTVIAVFILAWTPYHVDLFLYHTAPSVQPPCSFLFVATYLPNTYTAINPLLYCVFNEKYRQGFRDIVGRLSPINNLCHRCSLSSVSPE